MENIQKCVKKDFITVVCLDLILFEKSKDFFYPDEDRSNTI